MKYLVYLFVFCMIFANAFAISSVITISFGLSLVLFLYGLLKGLPSIRFGEPNYLLGIFVILLLSYVLFATGEKSTNHLLLWTAPPLLYYYMFKRILVKTFSFNQLLKNVLGVVYLATMVASLFALFEFVGRNFLGIDFSFIPRAALEDAESQALGGIRARSFMEEPGHFSFFLEIFIPLPIYWRIRHFTSIYMKVGSCVIMIAAVIVSFSAVGYVCLAIGAVLYFAHSFKSSKFKLGSIGLLLGILYIILLVPDLWDMLVQTVQLKMDSDNTSHASRVSRFDALKYLGGIDFLVGYGPAAFDTLKVDSFVSLYLGVLMNTGIIGFFFCVLFIIKMFKNVKSVRDDSLRFAFFLSLVFSTIHFAIIDHIYLPWFWVMLSLLCAIRKKYRDIKELELIECS